MVIVGVVVNRDAAQITAGPRVGLTESVLARATELGADAGRCAATWQDDLSGWTTDDLTALCEDVDPMILDRFTVPNLSGEWADDPTPRSLADDLGIRADSAILDAACTAWEDAAHERFWQDVSSAASAVLAQRGPTGRHTMTLYDASGNHSPDNVYVDTIREARETFARHAAMVDRYADIRHASAVLYLHHDAIVRGPRGHEIGTDGYPDREFTIGPRGGIRVTSC